ncbi:MAG: hypothetical protein ACREFP_06930 [Acetobacteraceae bacterium]
MGVAGGENSHYDLPWLASGMAKKDVLQHHLTHPRQPVSLLLSAPYLNLLLALALK